MPAPREEWEAVVQSRNGWLARDFQHVRAVWTPMDEDGEQKFAAWCETCGALFRRTCTTGRAADHVARFARVHAHGTESAPDEAELDEPLGPTPEERTAVVMIRATFTQFTGRFRMMARVDDPEVPADTLTPQRCREALAIVVGPIAVAFGIPIERLDWLTGRMLSLATPGGQWIPVHEYLEGKAP